MAEERGIRKVIWAVDVLEELRLHERAAQVIQALAHKGPIQLEAVYLPILAHLKLPALDFSGPWLEEYRDQTESTLTGILDRLGLGSFGRGVMIERNFASNLDAVKCLSDYAKESGGSVILVGTHGRSGLGRLLLGSFAETLLQYSEVPVMTVGPHSRRVSDIESILFPTDFGRGARSVYRQVVELGAELNAKLHVYHALQPSLQQLMQTEGYVLAGPWMPGVIPPNAAEPADGRLQAERRARRWVAWARERGVDAHYALEEGVGSVADAILATAHRKGMHMIAIESESGPVASMLLGSVTRHVVRQAECPVLILRPVKRIALESPFERAA